MEQPFSRLLWNYASIKYAKYVYHIGMFFRELFSVFSEIYMLLLSQDIDQYSSFAMLPKDISHQIFNKLVLSHLLTDVFLQKFHDCALEVFFP